ncbi:DUF4755 domain-containing protein [Pantoea sp. XAF26B01_ASV70]
MDTAALNSQKVRKPSFFRSIRLWIVVLVIVWILTDSNPRDTAGFLFMWTLPAFFLLLTAYVSYTHKRANASTIDLLNVNNSGIWSHEFQDSKMTIDTNRELLTLEAGKRKKAYKFNEVKGWRYHLANGGEIVALDLVGMAGVKGHNNLTRLKNFENSGFFIQVRDIELPEWQIKFHPRKGRFHHERGIRDTEMQLKQWCEIFDQTLNTPTTKK